MLCFWYVKPYHWHNLYILMTYPKFGVGRHSEFEYLHYFWYRSSKVIRFPKSGECIKAGDDRDRENKDCYIWLASAPHGFGDASERAYCAVVYLVLETSSGNYPVLLTSKTRVAPLTKQSIPRLELLSGVILARLVSSVMEALQSQVQISGTYLWLDSKTAVCWIKGSREWKQFVQNRVDEILSLTEASMWNHCPGIENPADMGSRGVFASKVGNSKLWWRGPSWLSEPVSSWPKSEVCHQSLSEECITE